jgi:hypothetical protein
MAIVLVPTQRLAQSVIEKMKNPGNEKKSNIQLNCVLESFSEASFSFPFTLAFAVLASHLYLTNIISDDRYFQHLDVQIENLQDKTRLI